MSTAKERAAARASWPVKRAALDEADQPSGLTAEAAWHATMELTWEAYSLAEPALSQGREAA